MTVDPITFKRHLVPHVVPGEAVYLVSELGVTALHSWLNLHWFANEDGFGVGFLLHQIAPARSSASTGFRQAVNILFWAVAARAATLC